MKVRMKRKEKKVAYRDLFSLRIFRGYVCVFCLLDRALASFCTK